MSNIATHQNLAFLDIKNAFNQLTEEEKLYVYYLNQANWQSFPISVKQCSEESYEILQAILKTFRKKPIKQIIEESSFDEETKQHFINYIVCFLANGGNYLSFGDKKFIPGLPMDKFVEMVKLCGENYFENVLEKMYDERKELLNYGLHPEGYTTYYSPNMTKEEIEKTNDILLKNNFLLENTRIRKNEEGIIVDVASLIEKEETIEGIKIKYGLYVDEMKKVIENLEKCKELNIVKENQHKREMFDYYIQCFTDDYQKHKKAQQSWVKDVKPSVEFMIGFIETYEDPMGVRGEWESFVAIVDKEKTKELTELVNNSNEILKTYPWEKVFEKDVFESPDFTSIDIVGFGTSGLPIGINLPNYDDIRMEGFKNVSLSNVMSSGNSNNKVTFISDADQDVYHQNVGKALELQVALHELLGHGSGRYLREDNGVKNFDENTINPLTNKPVGYYKDDQNYGTVFGALGSAMEECRAEAVGLFLTYNEKVGEIFKLNDDIKFINWLSEMRSGMIGLKFYNPETKKWGQAHCQARYALYKTIEKSGAVRIEGENVILDRALIPKAMEDLRMLLKTIQICRATADIEYAKQFFIPLSTPTEEDLKFRQIVIDKNLPRMQYIQCNTKLVDGKVELIEYEPTYEGMVQSYLDRFDN